MRNSIPSTKAFKQQSTGFTQIRNPASRRRKCYVKNTEISFTKSNLDAKPLKIETLSEKFEN